MFSVSADAVTPLDDPVHISPTAMLEKYGAFNNICWVGDGAVVHRDKIKTWADHAGSRFSEDQSGEGWCLIRPPVNLAEYVAMLASRKAQSNEVQDAKDLRAIYVRPSDAELKT